MGYGQPRSQARISPSPHPRPHSSATSVALPRCASARGTPPGTDATACTDMGTPEILRYAVWSAHCFLEDFSTGTLWIILRSAHRRTGVPAWTSGRRQRSGCHERPHASLHERFIRTTLDTSSHHPPRAGQGLLCEGGRWPVPYRPFSPSLWAKTRGHATSASRHVAKPVISSI